MLIMKYNNSNFRIDEFSTPLRHHFFSTQVAEIFMELFFIKWKYSAGWVVKKFKLHQKDFLINSLITHLFLPIASIIRFFQKLDSGIYTIDLGNMDFTYSLRVSATSNVIFDYNFETYQNGDVHKISSQPVRGKHWVF